MHDPTISSAGDDGSRLGSRGSVPDIPYVRIGLASGLVGMLCCVGPTILALTGVLTASVAADLANDLYGSYAWYFRGAGLLVALGLAAVTLRSRHACNIRGAMSARRKLGLMLGVAIATYAVLYAVTTWLGSFA
ncbi:MAG: hypothetical protein RIF41_36605 [Polyangiaceae bacterium]